MGQIEAIDMIFYPSTRRRADLDNKATGVLDLLVDCQIIPDDSWWVIPKFTLMLGGLDRTNPRVEITIYHQT